MTTYTIEVTDHGDVAAVATDGVATITVTAGGSDGGGGGTGAVDSVNGETGTVVLSAADVGAVPTTRTINGDPLSANVTLTAADVGADPAGSSAAAQAASQPLDSDLTAIAALTTTSFGRAFLALADAAAARTAIGAGTSNFDGAYASLTGKPTLGTAAAAATGDFDAAGAAATAQAASQPVDSDLTAIAALTTTSFGRSLLTQADAAAARTTLGAGTSSFDGAYSSLTGKPTLGTAAAAATTDFDAAGAASTAQAAAIAASQPLDSDLTAIAALTTTSYGRTFLTLANQAALVALLPSYQPLDSDLTAVAALTTTTYGRAFLELANQAALMALLSASSTTASGIVELATTAETQTGTDTVRAITPAGGAATYQPLDSDLTTVAGLTATSDNFLQAKSSAWASRTPTQVAADLALPVAAQAHTVNTQTGTTYTLVLTDAGKFVTMSNASASTLTVPPNSSVAFPVGTMLDGAQLGAGQVTLTAGAGVTINATPGLKVAAQYGTFGLLKTATDTWLAYGRLSA